ncbi:MAG: hypothetical protein COX02_00085 [Candidatus Vogelbacteria bacterium CG22_combo_CG10-13_8_21_14_all_37_9]|uniref:Uncharacterized protein n=1 Tax=Candidatus Vogelbacteria bacterium CG22_combo_CG10-13_8_21_14_all_37_9 TaxID=1975046 RepID=A0A2H0BN56_9BACT|nr:MAG: hypothetical protein BK005_00305 [bacterium CG10_37_50]PIP58470.1 MAG: hypothetical protein COX02_00085 [Candidatus Vogelbacteria bacterium CG22_combo_CG10-13_8_21_14_all_37_9]
MVMLRKKEVPVDCEKVNRLGQKYNIETIHANCLNIRSGAWSVRSYRTEGLVVLCCFGCCDAVLFTIWTELKQRKNFRGNRNYIVLVSKSRLKDSANVRDEIERIRLSLIRREFKKKEEKALRSVTAVAV